MQNTELLLKKLTLEEKCALLSGAETFKTRGMPEHGIPQIWLSDGPHGLRKQAGESDHLGLNPSVPATCFPTASAVANSWDAALGEEIGAALSISPRTRISRASWRRDIFGASSPRA